MGLSIDIGKYNIYVIYTYQVIISITPTNAYIDVYSDINDNFRFMVMYVNQYDKRFLLVGLLCALFVLLLYLANNF